MDRMCRGIALVVCALLAARTAASADVSGKWRFQPNGIAPATIVDVTDSGGVVSFTLHGIAFSGPSLTILTAAAPQLAGCGAQTAFGFLSNNQKHLRNNLLVGLPPTCTGIPGVGTLDADRCECFDGNEDDGDGCSARCEIEPCYTCIGMPSVCAPSADGAACDDRRDCTGGETCSAGVCGGGAPIASCHDLSGLWNVHYTSPYFGETDGIVEYTQRDGFIEGDGGGFGNINPAGGFTYYFHGTSPYIVVCPAALVSGGTDGLTFSADREDHGGPPFCYPAFVAHMAGTRCHNGSVDVNEPCDDGNNVAGDGCSNSCTVEQCWTCSGDPSVCTPEDGGSCDPGDACVTGTTCGGGACGGGTPVTCDACLSCDAVAGCIAAPRTDCRGAAKAATLVKNSATPNGDQLIWRWVQGADTPLAALGDPTDDTDYDVCVYDHSTNPPTVSFRAALPAGAGWKANRSGFVYRGTAVHSLTLKSGAAGRSKALLNLHGELPVPPLALPLTVQVQGENAACFSTTWTAPYVQTNANGKFKARN
jgi:cysteine-rich repeat protein